MLLRSVQCLFSFEIKRIKEELCIFIIVTIACILWVIIFQIGNIAIISLFFLFLFEFVEEAASDLLRYISLNVIIYSIIIASSMVLQQYSYKEDS